MGTVKMAAPSKLVSSVFRQGLFRNKVAVVTGGGTGIGKCITQELLFLGCNVMIASRQNDRLATSAKELRSWLHETKSPSRLEYSTCNVRKEEEVQNLMSSTLEKFGKLDFVVNNGGGQFISRAEDISHKGWNAVIDTNLTGTFLMCRGAYNQWMKDHGGAIVNIIADMWKGFPLMSHSGAARAAVDNLTKSLSIEWIANGVRVNSVAPGTIYSDTAAANYGETDIFAMYKHKVPYQRLGTVEEISAAVCFLLSPAASFVNGETLKVDAGQSLYSSVFEIPPHNNCPSYTWEEDAKDRESS